MKGLLLDHHGKARWLARCLEGAGVRWIRAGEKPDFCLVDIDVPWAPPEGKFQLLQRLVRDGVPLVFYPHGANPLYCFDGVYQTYLPGIHLVHGAGHVEVFRRFGYPRPAHVVGWSYTPSLPFEPRKIERVLYAPLHPWADGHTIPDPLLELNRAGFQAFLELDAPEKAVRYWGSKEAAGVDREDGITLIPSRSLGIDYRDIDWADLVISEGTYAYMALARGKPVIMMDGSSTAAVDSDGGPREPAHWDTYKDYIRYPLCLDDAPIRELAEEAASGSEAVDGWRDLFVGGPLNIRKVIEVLKGVRSQCRSAATST